MEGDYFVDPEEGDVVLVAGLVEVDVGDDTGDPAVDVFVGLCGVLKYKRTGKKGLRSKRRKAKNKSTKICYLTISTMLAIVLLLLQT